MCVVVPFKNIWHLELPINRNLIVTRIDVILNGPFLRCCLLQQSNGGRHTWAKNCVNDVTFRSNKLISLQVLGMATP